MTGFRKGKLGGNQSGLALLGSLLLVSMIAVMGTTMLLIMAADVRIGQSHHRGTQAQLLAESAAALGARQLSWNEGGMLDLAVGVLPDARPPLDTLATILRWSAGGDSFDVSIARPSAFPDFKRLLWVRGFSGQASYDYFYEIVLPRADPRLHFAVAAGALLDLRGSGSDSTAVRGGEGILYSGSNPRIAGGVLIGGQTPVYMGGSFNWDSADGIHTSFYGVLDLRSGIRSSAQPDSATTRVPSVLLSTSASWDGERYWRYTVTGSSTTFRARELTAWRWSAGSYIGGGTNPLNILVWRGSSNETFSGSFTLDGTIVCLDMYNDLTLSDGHVTLTGRQNPYAPDEVYPALVSNGDVNILGWGNRTFNGLVYVRDTFDSNPSGSRVIIRGALVANKVILQRRTTVEYDDAVYEHAPAFLRPDPVAGIVHPTLVLSFRRYLHAPWGLY